MQFFASAITTFQTLVIALGADAECERPAGQPGDREHSGQHGFHGAAVAGAERPCDLGKAAWYF